MKTGKNTRKNTSPSANRAAKARRGWPSIFGLKRVLVPVTLAIIITIGVIVALPGMSAPSYALTVQCTLSIYSGSVDIVLKGSDAPLNGTNGMTLDAGDRVRTSTDSSALLTFFDGSTLKLEPGTEIEIEQLERDDRTITIVLKQWMGKTWSHVVKMADAGSHYEIKTPSAVALVRGTQFLTEVNETGATKVLTAEGLVSVSAQGEEVFLPVGQQTAVEPGTPPSQPKTVDISEYVKSKEKPQKENKQTLSLSINLNRGPEVGPAAETSQDAFHGIANGQPVENSLSQDAGQGSLDSNEETVPAEPAQGRDKDDNPGNVDKLTAKSSGGLEKEKANDSSQGKKSGATYQDTARHDDSGDANPDAIVSIPLQDYGQNNGTANGNGQANGQGNDNSNASNRPVDNGQANGNGQDNGNPGNPPADNSQGDTNGQANGQGNSNGSASNPPADSGQANTSGQANGQANGNAGNQPADNGQGQGNSNSNNLDPGNKNKS